MAVGRRRLSGREWKIQDRDGQDRASGARVMRPTVSEKRNCYTALRRSRGLLSGGFDSPRLHFRASALASRPALVGPDDIVRDEVDDLGVASRPVEGAQARGRAMEVPAEVRVGAQR